MKLSDYTEHSRPKLRPTIKRVIHRHNGLDGNKPEIQVVVNQDIETTVTMSKCKSGFCGPSFKDEKRHWILVKKEK